MCLAGGMGLIRLPAWHVVRCVLRFFLRGWVGVTAPIPSPLTVSEEWMKRNGERDGGREGDLRRGRGCRWDSEGVWWGSVSLGAIVVK